MADTETALRVLIVEDSVTDTKLLIHALRASGLRPSWERVETASELEEALRRQDWHVVLSDSGVPGFGAAAALALTKEYAPKVPFFVVSGALHSETQGELLRLGAVDCIAKERIERLGPAILLERAASQARVRARRSPKAGGEKGHASHPSVLVGATPLLCCAGLAALVKSAGADVVGHAADGNEALRLIRLHKPDVALLDVDLGGIGGLEVASRLVKDHRKTRTLILATHASPELVQEAFASGASGCLTKDADPVELRSAVMAVARGEVWLDLELGLKETRPILTPRQREVLQLIVDGLSTGEIAERLRISVKTVETHRTALMARLDIHNVAGLVHYALSTGLRHRSL